MADKDAWIGVQTKTFTKWANSHLKQKGVEIESIIGGLSDGTNLCRLLEVISQEKIQFNPNPKMRIHKVENAGRGISFIEEHDVKLAGIGPEEIVDENVKMTLGLIWTLILRFVIAGLSEEGISAKQGLLLWVQKKVEPYKPLVNVEDFSMSWKDGLAFCALIHRHRPDVIDMDGRDGSDPTKNLTDAFDIAERELGVTKLIDPEDITDAPKPDEKIVVAYVAQLYQLFSGMDKIETAARRVNNFLMLQKEILDMAHDYEERARKLQSRVEELEGEFNNSSIPETYQEALDAIKAFRDYRKGEKRTLVTEEDDLAALFQEINVKAKSQGFAPYVAPEGLSVEDTASKVDQLDRAESARRSNLNNKMREIQENAQRTYADLANPFHDELDGYKSALVSLSGELEAQNQQVTETLKAIEGKSSSLQQLQEAEQHQFNSGVEVNLYTDHTYDDLEFLLSQVKKVYMKTKEVIAAQIAALQQGSIPAEKMQELQEAFNHFDEDKNGSLNRLELKSCLGALGVIDVNFEGENQEFESIFQSLCDAEGAVYFDKFAEYMADKLADRMDANQLGDSFKTLAGNKDFITDDDLRRGGADQELVEFVRQNVPQNEDGNYDYQSYLATVFN